MNRQYGLRSRSQGWQNNRIILSKPRSCLNYHNTANRMVGYLHGLDLPLINDILVLSAIVIVEHNRFLGHPRLEPNAILE